GMLSAASASVVTVRDAELDRLPLSEMVEVFEDRTAQLDVQAVLALPRDASFEPLAPRSASFGFTGSAWWQRVSVRNGGAHTMRVLLRQDYPLLDELDVFVVDQSHVERAWHTGDTRAFATRPVPHRDF